MGEIREALKENRFCLYYQPIVPVQSPRSVRERDLSVHCELLLRLYDAKGELVSPGAFIPAAERYDLMEAIDRWVLKAAFSRLVQPHCANIHTCAINLSGASLGDEQFLTFVQKLFKRFPVSPQRICFEITETAAIANLNNAQTIIRELRELGCRFALDDFGSGMSSFGYLKYLQVDYLKIDGEFVKDMVDDVIDRTMVEAINRIGHVMEIETIAEFVEDDQILKALKRLGVDYAQGFGIARPQPFDALLTSLASGQSGA